MLLGWLLYSILGATLNGAIAMKHYLFVLFSGFYVSAVVIDPSKRYPSNMSDGKTRKPTPTRFENSLMEAPPVEYEDQYEKRNAALQNIWSTVIADGHYMTSPFYQKAKCLLISWDPKQDDLHTEEEVCRSKWCRSFN